MLQAPTDTGRQVIRTFRAHPSALHEIRRFVRAQVELDGFPSSAAEDLVLAVSEACANAILHTNSAAIDVQCVFSHAGAEVRVRDTGIFRRRVVVPVLDEGHGRGIPLMFALMDEVSIHEGTTLHPGTLVRLVKYRELGNRPAPTARAR